MEILFHPLAEAELLSATAWLVEADRQVAAAFVDEIDSALERLMHFPEAGSERADGLRCYVLRKFRYLIIYRLGAVGRRIEVIAVAHASRRPGYWQDRLQAD